MADHKIDRAELERVLGLRIPESSTVEFSITEKSTKLHQKAARIEAATARVDASSVQSFQGRLVFEEGRLTEIKAINTDKLTLDRFKSGPVGPCW